MCAYRPVGRLFNSYLITHFITLKINQLNSLTLNKLTMVEYDPRLMFMLILDSVGFIVSKISF